MSKLGAVGRGIYSLLSFLVTSTCRLGMWVSLVASILVTIYAIGTFSKELINKNKQVLEIVYWRDPKKSGIALAVTLIAIFVLGKYPILTVLSYSGLAAIVGTLGFRVFKLIEAQVNKTPKENPFQEYLTEDISLPQERVHAQADVFVQHALCVANKLKKIFLVENIIDTVKFGLILWSLTYVAAWFSGFAIVLLTALGIFTIPKVYETYQEPIDQHLDLIKGHLNNVQTIVEEKLPFLKRQAEPEKKDQ